MSQARPWPPAGGGSSWRINHWLLSIEHFWDPPATHRQQPLDRTGCRKAGTGSIFYKQEEGIFQVTPQVSTLFALGEANKRPQTAQEEAAAPGPAGLERGGAAGDSHFLSFFGKCFCYRSLVED